MNCFPCFSNNKNDENNNEEVPVAQVKETTTPPPPPPENNNVPNPSQAAAAHTDNNEANVPENGANGARTFTFRELAMATKNFKRESLLGEEGFGNVYKGTLQTGEVVAVMRLDRNGTQGNKEFIVEVLMLTLLKHPNLVSLIGYCADGEQRLLVYEYLPLGSLKSYIHDLSDDKKPLDWQTRMKLASGAAQGLEYLHEKANPSIVYRDLKMANILLDEDFNPKLADYGLAKLVQQGDAKTHISPRVMGSYGYCAPEYEGHGELTTKSDIYSFGVVLLELITGRKALDTSKPTDEQNLVTWAQTFFKDPKRFPEMADPLLNMEFPERNLNQAVGIAAMCLQEEPSVRPLIGDLVALLSFLAVAPPEDYTTKTRSAPEPPPPSELNASGKHEDHKDDDSDDSDHEDGGSDHDDGGSDHDEDGASDHDEDGESDEEYMSESAYEFSDGSVGSDEQESQHQLHQESKQFRRKSSKHQSKKIQKGDSKKASRKASGKGSSSHKIKKMESDKQRVSFTSSSSDGSAPNSPRNSRSAADLHGKSAISRQTSVEESHNGSFGSSLGRGKYEESFSWSIGSSSKFKSRNRSGYLDSRSSKSIEHEHPSRQSSHDDESGGGSGSPSDYSDDENEQ